MTTYDGEQRERDLIREPDERDSDDEALPVEDTYDTYTTEDPSEAETVGELDTASVDLDDEGRPVDDGRDGYGGDDVPDTVDLDDEDRVDDETTEADVAELDAAESDEGDAAADDVEPVDEPAGYDVESVDEPAGYADETPAEETAAVLAEVGRPSLADGDHESRWKDIQAEFVDDPQRAMADADTLVADVLDDLTRTLSGERDALTAQWRDSEDPSTEDLRVTLRSYHVFLQRLVAT
jgi:hypothetical protein